MTGKKDWLPNTREDILSMGRDWRNVLGTQAGAWGIPSEVLTALDTLLEAARIALDAIRNEATRTPVLIARCREAFEALTVKMRDIKRRYFLTPPLTESDYISLGLKPHDTKPTPGHAPTAQVKIETFLAGRHELGLRIVYVAGEEDDPANKGYRIWYSALAPGEAPPARPEELRESFYTTHKKDVLEFDFADSGKTAWFAVQIENEGKKGPWGPLVSALIP
ncbi:MAG: hypothetical protein LBP86_02840 [Azoarcus sp.]|jgi:hypothetical protein|nr:hypothetical protein [Azoarcus sp.]